jgi:pyrophosphate--fructose-6-phosphate 1-phosphotransferase
MSCLKNLSDSVENWEVIGVPIYQMLQLETRQGKQKPVIRKALVNLQGQLFKDFCLQRKQWELADHYISPGPMQFEGPSYLTETRPHLVGAE